MCMSIFLMLQPKKKAPLGLSRSGAYRRLARDGGSADGSSHLRASMSEVRSEDDGRMNGLCFVHYAGRAGTGLTETELKRLAGVLQPLEVQRMPLDKPPPRETRFGSPLELSRVHWVRPEIVVEVTYLT